MFIYWKADFNSIQSSANNHLFLCRVFDISLEIVIEENLPYEKLKTYVKPYNNRSRFARFQLFMRSEVHSSYSYL